MEKGTTPAKSPDATPPVTRRSLRHDGRPRPLRVPVGARTRRPSSGRHAQLSRHRATSVTPGVGVTLSLGLTVAMLVGAIGGVSADLGSRQALATIVGTERLERIDAASTTRLTAQAELYADAQRSAALDAAMVAIADAGDVVVVATGVIQAEDVSPLDRAVTELRDLVDAAAPAPPEPVVASADPQTPAPPRTVAAGVVADIPPDPLPSLDDVPPAVQDLQVSARMIELAAEVADLTEQVRVLADAAAAELAAAQAAAAAELAAAQAAAAAHAAAELARKVAAVDASSNGAVPHRLLCGVGFDSGVLLRCDAAAALEGLNTAFRAKFGRNLNVSSSYRDFSAQVATREARGSLAAEPGTSNHGRGLAVDLDGFGEVGQFDRPYYRWMKSNAGAFGWAHPAYMGPGGSGPLEPWHWEYGTT